MVSPSYTLYTLYCVQKTTVYFDFYKQKNHRIYAVVYYNPHIKGANIYFLGAEKGQIIVTMRYDLLHLPFPNSYINSMSVIV